MSQWTHVAATIRFDDLRFPGMPDQTPDLGKTCRFDDELEDWDACTVPCGSEGSLQHHLWVNPERNAVTAFVATIWGDLRDYSDVGEITTYLNRVCAGRMIRQGVAQIEVEYSRTVVLQWTASKDPLVGEWLQVGADDWGQPASKAAADK